MYSFKCSCSNKLVLILLLGNRGHVTTKLGPPKLLGPPTLSCDKKDVLIQIKYFPLRKLCL